MKLLPIKNLIIWTLLVCSVAVIVPEVHANIPDKRICITNDKNQPLLFNGQGVWVRQNNATGSFWFKQADANGCAVFNPTDEYAEQFFKNNSADMNFDGQSDGPTYNNNGNQDMGCASGPFGFKVVMPKEWEQTWECQTVGTANAQFPCCRNENDKNREFNNAGCNVCDVQTVGYEGQQTAKKCYCDRSTGNGVNDADCPICFHNTSSNFTVTLQCKSKKTTTSKTLEKPVASQFSAKSNQGLACLTTQVCSNEEGGTACSKVPEKGSLTRRVRLTNYKALKQQLSQVDTTKPIWIVECVMEGTNEADASYKCTTGSSATDMQAMGSDNYTYLKNTYGYTSKIYNEAGEASVAGVPIAQPFAGTSTELDLYEWETTTTKSTGSVFMILYDQDNANAVSVGNNSGQQQAKLSFQDQCTLVQDPYGRVFDTHTLEPLKGTTVTLFKKDKDGNFKQVTNKDVPASINNPQKTTYDGMYAFNVPPGMYQLKPERSGYSFPQSSRINPAASFMYKNLYKGEDIIQEKEPIHLDIPMDPKDLKASEQYANENPITIMEYFQSIDKKRNVYVVQGRTSHPKATVGLYANVPNKRKPGSLVRTRTLVQNEADMFGRFKLEFPLSSLKTDETIGEIEVKKKSISFMSKVTETNAYKNLEMIFSAFDDLLDVEAGDKSVNTYSIKLNPILNNIDGFAYDASGNKMPNAVVQVFVPLSKRAVVATKADANGHFRIPSEQLPSIGYFLTFTSAQGKQEKATTSSFIAKNTSDTQPASRYYAYVTDEEQKVLGDYTQEAPMKDEEFNEKNIILLIAFIVVLISSIPLYHMYSGKPEKKKKN